MKFSFWPAASNRWEDTLALCRHVAETGWDGVWFADHFMPNTPEAEGPTHECWTTLAALAASVPRVRIGALVSGNTYRHPAVVANMARTIDHISGGRFVLGIGAGWQENEHQKYGIPFYTLRERLDRLEEACQVIRALFEQERATFTGRYYRLDDAPLNPKPLQRPLPLLVGGGGERRTMRIAARFADEWNTWGTPEVLAHKISVLEQHCRDVGRDPRSIRRSAQALILITEDAERAARARSSGRPVIAGSEDDVRDALEAYARAGVDEFIVPDFNFPPDLEQKRAILDRFRRIAEPLRS